MLQRAPSQRRGGATRHPELEAFVKVALAPRDARAAQTSLVVGSKKLLSDEQGRTTVRCKTRKSRPSTKRTHLDANKELEALKGLK